MRLGKQMVWAQVAIGRCDDRRAGLVANQRGNLGVCEPALACLRDEIGPQAVRGDVPDLQFLASRLNAMANACTSA